MVPSSETGLRVDGAVHAAQGGQGALEVESLDDEELVAAPAADEVGLRAGCRAAARRWPGGRCRRPGGPGSSLTVLSPSQSTMATVRTMSSVSLSIRLDQAVPVAQPGELVGLGLHPQLLRRGGLAAGRSPGRAHVAGAGSAAPTAAAPARAMMTSRTCWAATLPSDATCPNPNAAQPGDDGDGQGHQGVANTAASIGTTASTPT